LKRFAMFEKFKVLPAGCFITIKYTPGGSTVLNILNP